MTRPSGASRSVTRQTCGDVATCSYRVGFVEDGRTLRPRRHSRGRRCNTTLRTRSRHDGEDEEATIVGDLRLEDPIVLGGTEKTTSSADPFRAYNAAHVDVRGVVGGVGGSG
jgi:hypothetical protein